MDSEGVSAPERGGSFPRGLVAWSGNRGGGVRRLFDKDSGRPGVAVFETNLLDRLREWARGLAAGDPAAPRVVLLVGGPGNGKTEAVEATIGALDEALGCLGSLKLALSAFFHPPEGEPVPRLVEVDAGSLASPPRALALQVVQDASVGGSAARSAAQLLVEELENAAASPSLAYLCCVNRGVLDDAMIHAIDNDLASPRSLLEAVARSVSQAADAPECWPLHGFPAIAVWPMDAESLVEPTVRGERAPAEEILARAVDPQMWPESCIAGALCPFCGSRKLLAGAREGASLLKMLRWFELASGKRWAFRDLFSLFSHVLAGSGLPKAGGAMDPCEWAASQVDADRAAVGRPKRDASAAIFWLVSAQYQQALFHSWDRTLAASLVKDLRDLGLHETNNTAMGLYYFLQSRASDYQPAMIGALLHDFDQLLDPALASPDHEVVAWGGNMPLGDLDARFSRSVREGLDFAVRVRVITPLERLLLERLAELDELLSTPRLRRRRPTAATRVQRVARDFACRVARRSAGARQGTCPDAELLERFHRLVADADGKGHELHEVAIQVENLLNNGANFDVSLTTTFGQPMPPARTRAILEVPRRRVYAREGHVPGRPTPSLCFLDVDAGGGSQPIAVTYDLFKAVCDLERGLSPASLPTSVQALLDTTRARMAGSIVRDRHVQDRPTIHVGEDLTIERHRGRFIASKRASRA